MLDHTSVHSRCRRRSRCMLSAVVLLFPAKRDARGLKYPGLRRVVTFLHGHKCFQPFYALGNVTPSRSAKASGASGN